MSNPRYGSGRKQFVGQGIDANLSKLDPAAYPGAVAYSDGELYYSDGSEWVVPQDEVDIARPRNLTPTTSTEQSQLRLSAFRSPTGETQTGIIFEINTAGLPEFGAGASTITRTVTSQVASLYQVVYPDDGFQPGNTIWWRARYLGTNGTQSQFSIPTAQTFPDLITTPSPATPAFAVTGTVTVTPYDSPAIFSLAYFNTVTEFYAASAVPGVDAPLSTVTHINGATTTVPSSLAAGVAVYWRTRYSGRVSIGSPLVTSAWSALRGVVPGGQSMILEYNLTLASARTIGIPLAGTVNVTVNWGDGITETFTTAGVKTHTYASGFGPTVLVTISGTLTRYGLDVTVNQLGLTRVENWGFGLGLTSLSHALRQTTSSLIFVSPALPETVTNLSGFMISSTANPDLSQLDTSNVTSMNNMFSSATAFNQPIGDWDTSKVADMGGMFRNATAFNQPIGDWDTSSVTNMFAMFQSAVAFNQPIGTWDVSSVTNMVSMFEVGFEVGQPNAFNQDIGAWDTSSVTNMGRMFCGQNRAFGRINVFNNGGSPSINNWNVSGVTNMTSMFETNDFFNQPIGEWDVSSVTSMNNMFSSATAFNQPIGDWDTSSVTNMFAMFQSAVAFNQPIGTWDVSSVTNMTSMFSGRFGARTRFNRPVQNWDVSSVTSMVGMFRENDFFNQPISNWDMRSVTTAQDMFASTPTFNQDIGSILLRPAGVNLSGLELGGVNQENYSRTLIGWANYISASDGPHNVAFSVLATRQYNDLNYAPGERFTNAVAARAFLVGGRVVSVSGASDANANTTYNFNGTTQTYDAANGWFFAVLGSGWALYDNNAVEQAVGAGSIGTGPHTVASWTGVLSAATVLRTGAGWTITGDAAA